MSVAYRKPVPRPFETLLGSARPVSAYWDDMFEAWQPPVEKAEAQKFPPSLSFYDGNGLPLASGNNASQPKQFIVSQDGSGFGPLAGAKLLSDGTEILSDALPDPVLAGQQYAGGRPPRRGGGPPETPLGEIISSAYRSHQRALRKIEPNNPMLTIIQSPDWRPTQRDVDRMHQELLKARQRVPGAVDTQQSGIGIGPFARESILARSPARPATEEDHAKLNVFGYRDGCHSCGSRDPRSPSGNFVGDHQQPTRLNPPGQLQRLFPQCLSCSNRQGALIANEVKRAKP